VISDVDTLAAVAQSVTGPETPAAASVTSQAPAKTAWALVLSGPALSAMLIGCVCALTFIFWPDAIRLGAIGLATQIVRAVMIVACVLSLLLGLVVFRLASGGLRSVKASAGPGSIEVATGD